MCAHTRMKAKLLITIFAIFAAIGCAKTPAGPDFSAPVGHVYHMISDQVAGCTLEFTDDNHVKMTRHALREEGPRMRLFEEWVYWLSEDGKTINFIAPKKLALGSNWIPEINEDSGDCYVDETAEFKGNVIIWHGNLHYYHYPYTKPETYIFLAEE